MFDEAIHEVEDLSKYALSNQLIQSHPSLLPTLIKRSISSSTTKMAPKTIQSRSRLEIQCLMFILPCVQVGKPPIDFS